MIDFDRDIARIPTLAVVDLAQGDMIATAVVEPFGLRVRASRALASFWRGIYSHVFSKTAFENSVGRGNDGAARHDGARLEAVEEVHRVLGGAKIGERNILETTIDEPEPVPTVNEGASLEAASDELVAIQGHVFTYKGKIFVEHLSAPPVATCKPASPVVAAESTPGPAASSHNGATL